MNNLFKAYRSLPHIYMCIIKFLKYIHIIYRIFKFFQVYNFRAYVRTCVYLYVYENSCANSDLMKVDHNTSCQRDIISQSTSIMDRLIRERFLRTAYGDNPTYHCRVGCIQLCSPDCAPSIHK